jgi:flagella basal body P-ring formation protein FlgA
MTTRARYKRAGSRVSGKCLVTVVALLVAPSLVSVDAMRASPDVRDLIAAAVIERLGPLDSIDVDVLDAPATAGFYESATPAVGARLGAPMRFTLAGSGMPVSVIARVTVVAAHVVARQPIARNAAITADAVEVRHGRLDGVLLQPMPTLREALTGRPRRALAAGEVLTGAVLARTPAVRAGDEVAVTIRSGAVEATGVGRAASSGFVGDVIRITRPGSREVSRARVLAPASVEMVP